MMGLWIAEALAITAGTEFIYGVSISEYLKKQAYRLINMLIYVYIFYRPLPRYL